MDPAIITILIQQLGPLVVPLITSAATWLVNWIVGKIAPGTQVVINPVLPGVAAAIGAGTGHLLGMPPLTGAVYGLAGVGLHQLVKQPLKAARPK